MDHGAAWTRSFLAPFLYRANASIPLAERRVTRTPGRNSCAECRAAQAEIRHSVHQTLIPVLPDASHFSRFSRSGFSPVGTRWSRHTERGRCRDSVSSVKPRLQEACAEHGRVPSASVDNRLRGGPRSPRGSHLGLADRQPVGLCWRLPPPPLNLTSRFGERNSVFVRQLESRASLEEAARGQVARSA